MIHNPRFTSSWKKNLDKFLNKPYLSSNQLIFQSVNTGKNIDLEKCLFEDLLPYSLMSSPISSINRTDNVWITCSMLARVSDTTSHLVVIENEFPLGIIGGNEILNGIIKNPTPYFFHDVTADEIMKHEFYLDTRKAKVSKLFQQMKKRKSAFTILQNSKRSFSAISTREILEIGALCKTSFKASELKERKIKVFRRDYTIEDIIKSLLDDTELLILENESLFIDRATILEKIATDLNYLKNVDDFLELSASIFKLESPKLIPDKLTLPEICKIMLTLKHPYVMTSNQVWTPFDVLEVLSEGLDG